MKKSSSFVAQVGLLASGITFLLTLIIGVSGSLPMLFLESSAQGCTTFSTAVNGKVIFGKTYDWNMEQGYVMVNKRHVEKTAIALLPGDRPVTWQSTLGSVTFNQYGRELPNAGVNEAGLVVEVMVLSSSAFPSAQQSDDSINETQWVQYILDQASTIDDAVALANQVRISKVMVPLHYQVCDVTGDCAAFEYIGGILRISRGSNFSKHVLTNSTYADSTQFLAQHLGFGGSRPIPAGQASLDRFVRMSDLIRRMETSTQAAVPAGFQALDGVADASTKWRIIYEISDHVVNFRTQTATATKSVRTDGFDFSCLTPVKMINMRSAQSGDVTASFVDYDGVTNAALVRQSLGSPVPQVVVDRATAMPGTTRCLD